MKNIKGILVYLLVSLLAFSSLVISASAYTESPTLIDADVNLEVGTYSGSVFTPLSPGVALHTNDIITVRIAPTSNFLCGVTRYAVMFTKTYFEVVGLNTAAFTINNANSFTQSCSGFTGTASTTGLPESAWPAALKAVANGGNGAFTNNIAIGVNNNSGPSAPNGGYPLQLPGDWLFSFNLRVKADIPVGSGAKVWMDNNWLRKPGYTSGQMYFTKCLDSEQITGLGKSTIYNFNVDLTDANINLEPSANVPTSMTVTKTDDNMLVDIFGWAATDKYQIWSYQQVTSDDVLGLATNVKANQWILSNPYASGSAGVAQGNGSTRFTVPNFISPTENYVMAVRVTDASGNFIQELRGAFTPEDVGEVVIDKILVDDVVTTGYELKEIVGGAETLIKVIGNDEVGITYSAKVVYGPEIILEADLVNTNEFLWDISALTAGVYTIEITADNGSTSAIQEVTFELYNLTPLSPYASIDDMTLDLVAGGVNITPDFANGTFSYRVREPGRSPLFTSGQVSSEDPILYSITAPGVYHVNGYAMRAGLIGTEGGGYDDGLIKTLVIPRAGGGSVSMTFEADQTLPVVRNTAIVFTATATGLTNPQYSFWRYDATGYVLVKDWSSSNTLNWTPARLGEYQLEARAKGDGAGSYEVKKSLEVNITDPVLAKADVTTITLNTGELAAAQAKKPIMLKAAATGTDKDELLYKFFVYDNDMLNQQLRDYTVDQNCVWTPRENGTYTIIVLVKNENSFGKYDAIDSFEVIVD